MRRVVTVFCALLLCASAWSASFSGADAYVTGRDAEAAGRNADAITAYENCAKADAALAGFARVRAALCRARGGDKDGAVAQLRDLVNSEDASVWFARGELGTLLFHQGVFAEAIAVLQPIIDSPIAPRWLDAYERVYGDSLIALGNEPGFAKGLALFSTMLAEARTRTQRFETAKRLANAPDISQRLEAAHVYVSAGEFVEASKVLATIPAAGDAKNSDKAEYLRARVTLATDTNRDAGRTALLAVAKAYPNTESGRLALMHAARSYYSAGEEPRPAPKKEAAAVIQLRKANRDTAEKLFDVLTNNLPNTKETGDALWWLAQQHLEHDDEPAEVAAALAELQVLVKACPDHERAPDALFRSALILREQGDHKAAFAALQQVVEKYRDSSLVPAAAFDCGRLYAALGNQDAADKMFRRAVDAGGIGNFYAHRAQQRLAEIDPKHAGDVASIAAPGIGAYLRPFEIEHRAKEHAPLKDAWIDRMRFFADHGYEEAEWEVLAHAKAILESKHVGAYLAAISDAGLAATVDQIINKTKWGLKDERPTAEALPALYPRAYWPAVQKTANETGADPLLLLAIARQESLFQARIESHAGATGVMQLMPSTAAWIAKTDTAIGVEHVDTLHRPESSLRVGGYYYRYILGKQGGNTVFAVASYNAGPGNVNKWRARYDASDLDNFIEAIPFDETRDFVKKVLGNYAAYHSLYGAQKRVAVNN
ncbi:MAG: transglycosylase SLT domain-containing protein [Candidatus Hydrogenedentes bacterium]|nr:transglycosylase SLT domain-containing protein [Candidatus Hydrogenedentota bacterium]